MSYWVYVTLSCHNWKRNDIHYSGAYLFTSFVYCTNVYWSVIHGIKRKPHLSVVWNWYYFVAIAILHQPRPTDSADINTRLQLSDTSSIPPMHGGFLLVLSSMRYWNRKCCAKLKFGGLSGSWERWTGVVFFIIWPQFGGRTRWCSSFDSWARALAKLAVTNEFSSFRLDRRITINNNYHFPVGDVVFVAPDFFFLSVWAIIIKY